MQLNARHSTGSGAASPGWCSLRLRFDADELKLLRASERLFGAELARHARPEALRTAIALARAGQRVARAGPNTPVSLAEGELKLLAEAVDFAGGEVRWLGEHADDIPDRNASERQARLGVAFPELFERGGWRSFGLRQGLESLAKRLAAALRARP